ncbi:CxxC-x17-CxxC domain-containing protein [Patescibacteria group bacterium]
MGNFGRDNRSGSFSPRRRPNYGRDDRGGRGGGFSRGGDHQMHQATCSNCGKDCEVPFKPTSGKPVYCSDCFEKTGDRRSDSPGRSSFRPAPRSDQNKQQLEAINAKLDKLLNLLEPKVSEVFVPVSNEAEEKKPKAPKVKKVISKKKKV